MGLVMVVERALHTEWSDRHAVNSGCVSGVRDVCARPCELRRWKAYSYTHTPGTSSYARLLQC